MRVHLIIIIIIIIGFIIIAAAAAAAGRARLVYSCTALLVWRDTTAAITGQSTPHRQPAAGTDWGAGRMHLQSTPRRGDPTSLVYANWKAVKAFFSIAQFLNASITLV